MIRVSLNGAKGFIGERELSAIKPELESAHKTLESGAGPGGEFTGWHRLPERYDADEFSRVQEAAAKIRGDSDALIVIGIGGSYLGARAALEFTRSGFFNQKKKDAPDVYFAGNNISASYIRDVLELIEDKNFSLNVISKSGTTTEPAIAFRIFRKALEQRYGPEEAARRVYATTD
ncbi:MAG: glucose-6-phosphate isomerase, partial [Oscillospiraceae bacterium]|nr:glucose-6-phosphate isomerase [Oscillospiraceae bacterium]